jgi:small-conductance mechanosensitive channel
MAITDADASLEQVRRTELAAIHLVRIRQAVADYRAARSSGALRRAVINSLAATLTLVLAVAAMLWVWRWFDRVLARRLEARIHSVGIQSFEVMRAERIRGAFNSALLAIRATVLLAMALLWCGYVLGQFPLTRGIARNMVGFALQPLGVMRDGLIANIPSWIFLSVLFVVVRLGLRLLRLFFHAVDQGSVTLAGFEREWSEPTYKLVRLSVVALALVVAYPYIPGSDTAAFQGVSLFLGIVFSLGSSSAIANIVAGYMMTYRRALKVGDRVKIGEAFGDVVATRLQVTHLRSVKNEEIIIPNSQILAGDVVNYSTLSRDAGLILHTTVTIGYGTPWRQVEAMLLDAVERTAGLEREPAPFVLEKDLGTFAVTYEVNAYCRDVPRMQRLYAQLHRHILDVFNEHGVQIMVPAYEADPPEPKVATPPGWEPQSASVPTTRPARATAPTV